MDPEEAVDDAVLAGTSAVPEMANVIASVLEGTFVLEIVRVGSPW